MKRFIPLFFTTLFMLSSCGNSTSTQNVRVSESSGGWEYIGLIEDAVYPNPSEKQPMNRNYKENRTPVKCTLYIYMREIAGEKCVGAKTDKSESDCCIASQNPYFGEDVTTYGSYKYRINKSGTYYYFNLQ